MTTKTIGARRRHASGVLSRRSVLRAMTGAGVMLLGGGAVALATSLPEALPVPTPRPAIPPLTGNDVEDFSRLWDLLTERDRQVISIAVQDLHARSKGYEPDFEGMDPSAVEEGRAMAAEINAKAEEKRLRSLRAETRID